MAKIKGLDAVVKVGDTPTTIAVQRGATLNATADTIVFTDKSASGWSDQASGLKNWSVDLEAIWDDSDAQLHTDIWGAFNGGTDLDVELHDGTTSGTSNVFSGTAQVTNFTLEAPHDGECSVSVTLVGRGALSKTALS